MTHVDRHHGDEPVPDPAVDAADGGVTDGAGDVVDDGADVEPIRADDEPAAGPEGIVDGATDADDVEGAASAPPEADEADAAVAAEEDPRSREELLTELTEAESRRDEYLDDLRRARAEFDNFRRRTMKEGATQRDLGKADVLTALLEVLDDLDRTLEAADASDDANLAKGIGLVAGKLVQALQSQGLERIDAIGVPFDPNLHEAVQQVEAEQAADEPTVAQVLRPGYCVGDRVLRAAMVVVEQ